MHSFAARFASYHSDATEHDTNTNNKRRKSTIPRDFVPWPHPDNYLATPTTLADAGFFHDPSPFDVDSVACFLCGKELGEWEPEDDPFAIHAQKCPKCPWVLLGFGVASDGHELEHDTETLPPLSNILYKARLSTFGIARTKWWPHDKSKSKSQHSATSRSMANAGFIYLPDSVEEIDDTATCLYCDLTLSGWEADDDPLEQHISHATTNGKTCAFLRALKAEEDGSEPSTGSGTGKTKKTTKATKGKKTSTTTRKKTTTTAQAQAQEEPRTPLKAFNDNRILNNVAEDDEDDAFVSALENLALSPPVHPIASPTKPKRTTATKIRKSLGNINVNAKGKVKPDDGLLVRKVVEEKEQAKLEAPPPPAPETKELFPSDLKLIIKGRFELCGRLGSGSFGTVYRAYDTTKPGKLVAIKLEHVTAEYKSLSFEASVYRTMKITSKTPNVGKMLWAGAVSPPSTSALEVMAGEGTKGGAAILYRALVMPLFGPSLQTLWAEYGMRFKECTVMRLAVQMIDALAWVHGQRVIHRDIKPDNFVVGLAPHLSKVYLIDFGLAKVYAKNDGHIPFRDGKSFVGNFRFAGVGTSSGIEPARRDDLEAIAYVLIYLLSGDLPWRRFEKDPLDPDRILAEKLCVSPYALYPRYTALGDFVVYSRSLHYEEKPDYERWKDIFARLAFRAPGSCWQCTGRVCRFEWVK